MLAGEGELSETTRPRWLLGCCVAAALGVLMLLAACRLGEAGVRRNVLHPPNVSASIAGVQLRARTIDFAPMCDSDAAVCAAARARGVRIYIVWADIRWPSEQSTRHYPVISIPLDPRPAD
jgi:hypothetical protein